MVLLNPSSVSRTRPDAIVSYLCSRRGDTGSGQGVEGWKEGDAERNGEEWRGAERSGEERGGVGAERRTRRAREGEGQKKQGQGKREVGMGKNDTRERESVKERIETTPPNAAENIGRAQRQVY